MNSRAPLHVFETRQRKVRAWKRTHRKINITTNRQRRDAARKADSLRRRSDNVHHGN